MSINEYWFDYLKIQIGIKINDDEKKILLEQLSIQEEVLPFLVLKMNAFSEWDKFSTALIDEANSSTDFSTLRPKSIFDGNSEMEVEKCISKTLGNIIESDLSQKEFIKSLDEYQEGLFVTRDDYSEIFTYRIQSNYK